MYRCCGEHRVATGQRERSWPGIESERDALYQALHKLLGETRRGQAKRKETRPEEDGMKTEMCKTLFGLISACCLSRMIATAAGSALFTDIERAGIDWLDRSFERFSHRWRVGQQPSRDPDVELTTLQMIEKAGYTAEGHFTITEDGYILTIHRIRGSSGSRSVFLQHGLLGSSADWVISGPGKALAYILADHGYDVWLGNFRGNTYSRAHVNISSSESEFWNFSWHEMGVYDLPAMIRYILKAKGEKRMAAYVGYSMGTTSFYVMASEEPKMGETIELMISLAPVGYMSHLKSPIRLVAPFANDYKAIAHFLGEDEFLPQNGILKFLAKYGCNLCVQEEEICANSLFVICGFDAAQFNYTLLPVILSHCPAGASTKTLVHYGQEILSGYFRQYDYGVKKNQQVYNSAEPPSYDISRISVPVAVFYSENDWLASPVDVSRLLARLRNVRGAYKVAFKKFNHLDYLWGIDARELVYDKVMDLLVKNVSTGNEQSETVAVVAG